MASFREKIASFQLVVYGTHLVELLEVTDAIAIHFHLVYNSASPGVFPSLYSSLELLSLSPVSVFDFLKLLNFLNRLNLSVLITFLTLKLSRTLVTRQKLVPDSVKLFIG
jgi:hypothetical protein